MSTERAYLSTRVLDRQATIATEVIGRHGHITTIAALAPIVASKVERFRIAQEAIKALKVKQNALLSLSNTSKLDLHRATGSWTAILVNDIPGFDPSEILVPYDVALDTVANARDLLHVVGAEGTTLPYAEQLATHLKGLSEAAAATYEASQTARVGLQEKQAEGRTASLELQRALVALRHALRNALGSSHVDCRRLRVDRRVFEAEPVVETTASDATTA